MNPMKRGMGMNTRTRWIAIGAVSLAALGAGTGIAVASGGDDDATDRPITGTALDRARAAALEHTGGGRVSGTEVGDEEGYYEVEVRLDDGRQVDVHLDRDFNVLDDEADGPNEDEGPNER